nr:FapA family protein [Spirochaetota bacterium]
TRAREEINVKNLGNENSPTTIVEVGIDPKSREKFDSISEEKRQLNDKVVEAAKNIITLQNQKGSGMLSPEKESMLQDLIVSKAESEARIKEINEELEELKSFMNMLETKGKVSVQKLVYPGARIIIKNATLDVKDNFKFTTFMQEGGIVRATVYEQPKEEGKARPAGKR